jgi:hypothetical protein
MKWWSVLSVILLFSAVSCARKDDQVKAETEEPPRPTASEQSDEGDTGEVLSKREITLTQAKPAAGEQPAAANQPEQQRLLTLESSQVLPEDFKIGPLANLVGIDRNTQEMVSVATRFLNGLQEGTVVIETLHNSVREELKNSVNHYLNQELIPITYRIGTITTQSQQVSDQNPPLGQQRTAWMNIRLFGSPGVCEGELYLENSGGRWYISDLQTNFELLKRAYSREQEKYYPSAYGWGIQ